VGFKGFSFTEAREMQRRFKRNFASALLGEEVLLWVL
jgi:hypothetical protein